jgi:hypothetical protein
VVQAVEQLLLVEQMRQVALVIHGVILAIHMVVVAGRQAI